MTFSWNNGNVDAGQKSERWADVVYFTVTSKELPAADRIEAMEALLPWRLSPVATASDVQLLDGIFCSLTKR
jgi:hypothetical protein